jgi:putative glycosyltransferase
MKIGIILDKEITKDQRVLNEIEILEKHGHQIFVLCLDLYNLGQTCKIGKNISVTRFKMSNRQREILFGIVNRFPLYNWIWQKHIRKFIKDTGVEALHTHDLYMSKPVYMANKKYHLPIILDLHENFPAAIQSYTWATRFPKSLLVAPKLWSKKEKRYLQYADHIVVLCESFRNELQHKYPALSKKRFAIYPNVPNVEELMTYEIHPEVLPNDHDFILFYFGAIGVRRGLITCFEALKKISGTHPRIKLLLIGPIDKGDQELFKKYMEDPAIKEQIIYFKWKNLSEFPSYVHQSHVGISPLIKNPQHDSGIANKVFQYMLFETPVLVSDCTPQLELVQETLCGLTFHNQDVDDLTDKILYLYNHPEQCKTMGEMGKKAVLSKYNMITAGNELDKLYHT